MRTVLLVEDNAMDVLVIREAIRECGLDLRLQIANNGQEALSYLQDLSQDAAQPSPALVLLDLNLPKIAGIEVLRILRADGRWNHIPVIVVTSSGAGEDYLAVERLGAQAYFQKPSDLNSYMKLSELMKSVLGVA